ncbi:GAF domain-containing protein [Brevibacillus sp. SYP-B805]|uniref:helix-turn-helix domain-containing protein n=1 Tax=Brevibacillus sp. SYP-B805 TaxID=1578199 RepID=UPI0013ECCAE9|nr:GAF domain-containing protein [Brevibacillus sp. SYP-B805]NGQ95196.1 GAF domain-containing protein [Brevibacillus sp. SYP-B805]
MSTLDKISVLEMADFMEELTTLVEQEGEVSSEHLSLDMHSLPDCLRDAISHFLLALEKRKQRTARPREEMARSIALQQLTLDIASLAPLQQVLHRVCETVRLLLQTDIGYIALYNEKKQTITIRASSGSSPNLIGVEQRLGQGIGGRVVLTKRPHSFTDYPHETRRDPNVEAAIDYEGIISAIAVPLLLGADVIGVLYAAMRTHREFTEEEIDFLASLASLASVAIRNAQLYDQSQRLIRVHQQLSEAALQKEAVESVIRSLSLLLSCETWFLDASGHILHRNHPHARLNPEVISAIVRQAKNGIHTLSEQNSIVNCFFMEQSNFHIMCSSIVSNHVLVGILATVRPADEEYDEIDRIAIERATTLLALAISTKEIKRINTFYLRTALLHQLLFQGEQEAVLGERAKHLGINLWKPCHLIVSMCMTDSLPPSQQEIVNRVLNSVQLTLDVSRFPLSTVDNTCLVAAIANQETLMKGAEEIHALIKASLPQAKVFTVISDPCSKPSDYRHEFSKCKNALSWHERLGHQEPIVWAKSFGLAGLLLDVSNLDAIRAFCVETLRPLTLAEHRQSGNLLETLKTFLENESELRATASSLHIHYNTLRYRLERIEQILQVRLSDAETRQKLRLALLLNDTFKFIQG